jgi:phospholipid/cholesterol/gamma-HCH transport system substrate-binding protein
MDERVMQFRVGVMFLATLLITGILLVMFGKLPSLMGRTYTVQIEFDDAGGVAKDTPVRKSGILIGRVSDVELIDKDAKVIVTAKIQSDKFIYQNEVCSVMRNLLSGDTALAFSFVPGRPGAGKPIDPNTILHGYVSDDPTGLKRELQKPIDTVMDTGKALKEASEQLGAAARRVEEILDPDTQKNVQSVLKDAAASLSTIREMLGDDQNREKLSQAVRKLPDTLDSMNSTFQSTDKALRAFTQPAAPGEKTAVERMINTIEMTERTVSKFSESRGRDEPSPADQIASAMDNIGEITRLMKSIMERIDRGEGSLGALMNDRQLYNRLNNTARNLEEVSCKLKPIIDDARVFTDKISRHPGVIVRDAVKPGVGIK